jgi:hypothetical protein
MRVLGVDIGGTHYQSAFGRPVKVVNDAAMQALGRFGKRSPVKRRAARAFTAQVHSAET